MLAVDRNNAEVQYLYDEMNPAVLNSISYVIRRCKKYKVETSICGQAGSREDMARFLISQGIDSISVNADAAYKISRLVAELESVLTPPSPDESVEQIEKKDEQKESKLETGQEIKVPVVQQESKIEEAKPIEPVLENKDIEEIVLNELGNDDYGPGSSNKKNEEIPKLNDAIPVESEHFEDKKDDNTLGEEIVLNEETEENNLSEEHGESELSEEWKGEDASAQEMLEKS